MVRAIQGLGSASALTSFHGLWSWLTLRPDISASLKAGTVERESVSPSREPSFLRGPPSNISLGLLGHTVAESLSLPCPPTQRPRGSLSKMAAQRINPNTSVWPQPTFLPTSAPQICPHALAAPGAR